MLTGTAIGVAPGGLMETLHETQYLCDFYRTRNSQSAVEARKRSTPGHDGLARILYRPIIPMSWSIYLPFRKTGRLLGIVLHP